MAAANAKLQRVLGPPLRAEVATAQLDVAKARADLTVAQAGRPDGLAAAEFTVAAARRRLASLTGTPDPTDAAAAQLDVAKAVVDQETLLRAPVAPSAAAVSAGDLAIALAQQHLTDALAGGTPADVAGLAPDVSGGAADHSLRLGHPPCPVRAVTVAPLRRAGRIGCAWDLTDTPNRPRP